MFDYLRNLTKTEAEKRQEALTAYLDDALSAAARRAFEAQLAQDADLRADLEQQRAVRQSLRRLPQRRVPRNFTLDPALYGRPARQTLGQYYPALRAATVLTAVLFFFAVGLGLYTGAGDTAMTAAPAADVAMEPARSDAATAVEVTRLVTEVEEMAAENEEPAPDSQADGAVAEMEEAAEEAMAAEEEMAETTEEAEDAAAAGAMEPVATAVSELVEGEAAPAAQATLTPLPTPTQSLLPRATATEFSPRVVTPGETVTLSLESTAVAQFNYTLTTESAAETEEAAVSSQRFQEETVPPAWSGFQILAVALLLLFVVLLAVTLYARRQW